MGPSKNTWRISIGRQPWTPVSSPPKGKSQYKGVKSNCDISLTRVLASVSFKVDFSLHFREVLSTIFLIVLTLFNVHLWSGSSPSFCAYIAISYKSGGVCSIATHFSTHWVLSHCITNNVTEFKVYKDISITMHIHCFPVDIVSDFLEI